MTDNEIIKALECCAKAPFCRPTADGPYKCVDNCVERHALDAIDLINRQNAEIERLRYNLEAVLDERADHSEAVKEFVERLEKRIFPIGMFDNGNYGINAKAVKVAIESIKKEMVGDDNG